MNKKIKSIDIEAFRGYDAKQVFNLTDLNGLPANLNVLYAPNGFGKTSFLDAIEWALTGQITRFQRNGRSSVLFNAADRHAGRILHNYESAHTAGSVTIVFEDNKRVSRSTKLNRRDQRQWDLNPGTLEDKSGVLALGNSTGHRVVDALTQESTDQAVCFTTPEERFDALKRFWDNNNDTETYKSILGMNRIAREQRKELELEIAGISAELAASFRLQGINALLNEQVNALNKLNPYELESFQEDINPELLNKRLELFISLRNNNSTELLGLNESVSLLNILEINLDKYDKNIVSLKKIDKELSLLASNLLDIKTITTSANNISVYKSRRVSEIMTIGKLNGLNALLSDFISINTVIIANNKNIELLTKNIDAKVSQHTIILTISTQLKTDFDTLQLKIDKLANKVAEARNKYGQLLELSREKEVARQNLTAAQERLTEQKAKIEEQTSFVIKLESHLNLTRATLETIESLSYPALTPHFDKLKTCLVTLLTREKIASDAESNLRRAKDLLSSLKNIADLGKQIALNTQATTCPLCKAHYDSFEQLLFAIESEHNTSNNSPDIASYRIEAKQAGFEYEAAFAEYANAVSSLLQKNSQELLEQKQALSTLDNQVLSSKVSISNIDVESAKLELFLKNELGLLQYEEVLSLIPILEGEVVEYKSQLAKLAKDLRTSEENGKSLKDEIDSLENIKQQYVVDNLAKRTLPNYSYALDLMTQLNISLAEIQKIVGMLEQARHVVDDLTNRIDVEELTISTCLERTQDKTSDEVEAESLSLRSHKTLIEQEIASYSANWNKLVGDAGKSPRLAAIAEKNVELADKAENAKILISRFNDLIDFVESIKKGAELNNQLRGKKEQLAKVILAAAELEAAKKKSITYIKNKISREFNEELINEIYQKVEPHPTLRKIKFVPELDGDRAKLDILVKTNSSDTNDRAPVIYFSSAQINILSLSIFLAKSLQNENKIINTIFMDDPIQFLDSINALSFIDLIRMIISKEGLNQQVFISTHDENFFKLLQKKIDPAYYSANFMELETFGVVKNRSY